MDNHLENCYRNLNPKNAKIPNKYMKYKKMKQKKTDVKKTEKNHGKKNVKVKRKTEDLDEEENTKKIKIENENTKKIRKNNKKRIGELEVEEDDKKKK